jgi:predicted N-acyltransferase
MGFNIVNIGLWQTIPCQGISNKSSYIDSLKHSSRKVIKKFRDHSVSLLEINKSDSENIKATYDLINKNRLKIDTRLKYTLSYLIKLIESFPTNIRLFFLKVNEESVAAAICHVTQDKIMYVAAWGDYGHQLEYSPMYNFAAELVDLCLQEGIHYLDFGISSDLNLYTPKLHSFKQNIGCETFLQNTFSLNLYGNDS